MLAFDVESVGVLVLSLVAVGGAHQYHKGGTRRHQFAVQFDIGSDIACGDGARVLEPQDLLDGVGNQ